MTDRRSIPIKRRVQIFLAQEGLCFVCKKQMRPGQWEVDHRQALIHGGDDAADNLKALCSDCHKAKTAKDVKAKAKVARLATGGKTRKGPPMAGSRKSKWKRKMDGSIVER